jgi:hypothetical protein
LAAAVEARTCSGEADKTCFKEAVKVWCSFGGDEGRDFMLTTLALALTENKN